MKVCASLQFDTNRYLTTGYSRNLLLAMSLVDCLNSSHKIVNMFIFVDVDEPSSDDLSWSLLKENVSTWLKKLFHDAHFMKTISVSFNDNDVSSGKITLDGHVISITFIYNNNLNAAIDIKSGIESSGAEILLINSNFSTEIGKYLHKAYNKLKILLVEQANINATKTLPISSVSDVLDIWNQLKDDSQKNTPLWYAAYSVGINDIFIKLLQIINDSASIKDLVTNNSFFELINTSPLEITSSGNNIASSVRTILPALNGKIDKIKYIRTFATSLKNKGDKIIIKLNSIKIDRQITKESLNKSIVENFNKKPTSSQGFIWTECEFVDRSVNVKETDKLYFILTDTICEEIQTIQTDNKTIYEYNLRLVFEIDSIMKYMSKLVLLIVNNLSAYLPSK